MLLTSLLFISQIVSNICLALVMYHVSRLFKISLTIHNIPVVLMWCLGLLLAGCLAIVYPSTYLVLGAFVSIMLLVTADYSQGVKAPVILSLSAMITWAQLIVFVVFCMSNQDKMEEEE